MGRRVAPGSVSGTRVTGTLQADTIRVGTGGLTRITETLATKTGATGTVVHDFTESQIWYHSSMSANFTANFTNIPTTDSRTISLTLVLNQGATGYYPSAVQIDGVGQTLRWLGNVTPTATSGAGKIDVATFNLIRTGAAWFVTGVFQAFA
jgi:hypothetical protein